VAKARARIVTPSSSPIAETRPGPAQHPRVGVFGPQPAMCSAGPCCGRLWLAAPGHCGLCCGCFYFLQLAAPGRSPGAFSMRKSPATVEVCRATTSVAWLGRGVSSDVAATMCSTRHSPVDVTQVDLVGDRACCLPESVGRWYASVRGVSSLTLGLEPRAGCPGLLLCAGFEPEQQRQGQLLSAIMEQLTIAAHERP
jgi:hypothetical protein